VPIAPTWAEPVWHLFVVRHRERNLLQQKLTDGGVGTLIHYPVPPHLSGAYADHNWSRGAFPVAEDLADKVLSLPIGPHLRKEQAEFVIETVNQVLKPQQTEPVLA
jgi:dTDP-4-amino-4,6-dideoxygalactose transaminase